MPGIMEISPTGLPLWRSGLIAALTALTNWLIFVGFGTIEHCGSLLFGATANACATDFWTGLYSECLMKAEKFRRLALEIPGALESSHMDHPDFRIDGKIFATLGYPDEDYGMVKLTPEQQRTLLERAPTVFAPCAGAWGRQGATSVHLRLASVELLRAALNAASKNITRKKMV
jgi:hypothetical protein